MVLSDLVLAALSDDDELGSRHRVMEALRSHGAISPAAAQPIGDLNVANNDTWRRLIVEGRVREGPPGHFYLFETGRPSTRRRVVKTLVFWLIILLIPVVLIFLTSKSR